VVCQCKAIQTLLSWVSASVKMVRYTIAYWTSGSYQTIQREFCKKYGGRTGPSKSAIHHLVHKTETTGTLLTAHGGARPRMSEDTVQDVRRHLLDSPKKSLRRLSQETGMSKSTCHRASQKAEIHAYRVTAVYELKEPDREKRVEYCRWLQAFS
jgi:hypothetical protein